MVMTQAKVRAVIAELRGIYKLLAMLLYGTGMRSMETLRLRVHDFDFERREITIREGKAYKDRRTMLPASPRRSSPWIHARNRRGVTIWIAGRCRRR